MEGKRIIHKKGLLHIETPLGIVNVRVGLKDMQGYPVDSVEVIPDQVRDDNLTVGRDGLANTRLIGFPTADCSFLQNGETGN